MNRNRVKWSLVLVMVVCAALCEGAKVQIDRNSAESNSTVRIQENTTNEVFVGLATHVQKNTTDNVKVRVHKKKFGKRSKAIRRKSSEVSARAKSEGRFFLGSLLIQMLQQNIEAIPAPLRGPLMFAMGFSQQSMENLMSNMRSFGQMIISSLVMMAVRRYYFSDLPTEADRNKAGKLTDAIMDVVNLFI